VHLSNKDLVRKWVDLLNSKDWSSLGEVWGQQVAVHAAGDDITDAADLESLRRTFEPFFIAFPDSRITIEQLVSEDDLVVGRFGMRATHSGPFAGYPASGKVVEWTSTNIYRVEGGRIVEEWVLDDMLTLMRGIGAVQDAPRPG
jgi:steroid delta-isomerase-like uncharacterized protein